MPGWAIGMSLFGTFLSSNTFIGNPGKAFGSNWNSFVFTLTMPIAAVMLDLGFSSSSVKAVPLLARTAGLLAHLVEEQQHPLGFLMAARAEEAIDYQREPEDERE